MICGVSCGSSWHEPVACAYPPGHDGAHSWASIPPYPTQVLDEYFGEPWTGLTLAAYNALAAARRETKTLARQIIGEAYSLITQGESPTQLRQPSARRIYDLAYQMLGEPNPLAAAAAGNRRECPHCRDGVPRFNASPDHEFETWAHRYGGDPGTIMPCLAAAGNKQEDEG